MSANKSSVPKQKSSRKLDFPGKSLLAKSRDPSPRPIRDEGAAIQVDLGSTLSQFGHAGFDATKYFSDRFAKEDVNLVGNHYSELLERKNVVSRALKNYVTEHYSQFIHTSQELQHVENDMSALHNIFVDFRSTLKTISDATFVPDREDDDEEVNDEVFEKRTMKKESKHQEDSLLKAEIQSFDEVNQEVSGMVYERQFEQAINVLEITFDKIEDLKKKESKATTTKILDNIKQEFESISNKLTENLINELKNTQIKKMERRRLTSLLIRLGKVTKAVEIFLEVKSNQMRESIRQITLQGDLSIYIDELASLIFSFISNSSLEFSKLFPDAENASFYVVWATNEIKEFCMIFRRQVFNSDSAMQKIGECIRKSFSRALFLEKNGFKMSYLLSKIFEQPLRERILKSLEKMSKVMTESVDKDQFIISNLLVRKFSNNLKGDEGTLTLKLSSSAKSLYSLIEKFMVEMRYILNLQKYPDLTNQLYTVVVEGVTKKIEDYIVLITDQSKKLRLTDSQNVLMVHNAFYIADDLICRVHLAAEKIFCRKSPEIFEAQQKLQRFFNAQRDIYIKEKGGNASLVENLKLVN